MDSPLSTAMMKLREQLWSKADFRCKNGRKCELNLNEWEKSQGMASTLGHMFPSNKIRQKVVKLNKTMK